MPETTPTIPAADQRTLAELKAVILDAADDALLDAYATGRDAGLTEQQAKLDAVVAERARTTNHLYGLLQKQDAALGRAANLAAARGCDLAHAKERIAELNRDLAAHGKLVGDGDRRIAELNSAIANLEHTLRVSQANHATDRERLDTEIRSHQKTRAELAAVRSPQIGGVGGSPPVSRIGERVHFYHQGKLASQIVYTKLLQVFRHQTEIRAVEFPVGHIVWAATVEDMAEVLRLNNAGK